jgi:hypothetical protein
MITAFPCAGPTAVKRRHYGKGAIGSGPLYDMFVVRLWCGAATGRLRAKVEHAPIGALAGATGVSTGWVLSQISARLVAAPPTDCATRGVEATPNQSRSPHSPSPNRG